MNNLLQQQLWLNQQKPQLHHPRRNLGIPFLNRSGDEELTSYHVTPTVKEHGSSNHHGLQQPSSLPWHPYGFRNPVTAKAKERKRDIMSLQDIRKQKNLNSYLFNLNQAQLLTQHQSYGLKRFQEIDTMQHSASMSRNNYILPKSEFSQTNAFGRDPKKELKVSNLKSRMKTQTVKALSPMSCLRQSILRNEPAPGHRSQVDAAETLMRLKMDNSASYRTLSGSSSKKESTFELSPLRLKYPIASRVNSSSSTFSTTSKGVSSNFLTEGKSRFYKEQIKRRETTLKKILEEIGEQYKALKLFFEVELQKLRERIEAAKNVRHLSETKTEAADPSAGVSAALGVEGISQSYMKPKKKRKLPEVEIECPLKKKCKY